MDRLYSRRPALVAAGLTFLWYNCSTVGTVRRRSSNLADILPFQGIRYNTAIVDPDDVTSPPYDVISQSDLEHLLSRHPKNVVRLILGKEERGDSETDNRYTRAACRLDEWLADGTLVRDDPPRLYACEQRFEADGRQRVIRGFTALVRLHSFDEGVILPHEFTLARPKSHLAPLIRSTNSNLDSVYGLFPDAEGEVERLLAPVFEARPDASAIDRQGVRHSLWVVCDAALIRAAREAFRDREVVIADGHHRYETSLAYRDEMRENSPGAIGDRPWDFVMMTLVSLHSPDLVVYPTHRMLSGLPESALNGLPERLAATFDVTEVAQNRLVDEMGSSPAAIGLCTRDCACLLTPKPEANTSGLPGVLALHDLILGDTIGIDGVRLRLEEHVSYTRDEGEAIGAARSGDCQAAFLLRALSLEQLLETVRAGRRLPQKSTYFYPKLLSGLVMRKIE